MELEFFGAAGEVTGSCHVLRVNGRQLLLDCGLVRRENTRIVPTSQLLTLAIEDKAEMASQITLRALATSPAPIDADHLGAALDAAAIDATQREEFLLALGQKFDDAHRQLIGEIGEELVVHAARGQLSAHGHNALAAKVRRVSIQSDALGYDITAPRPAGTNRLLEVKAGTNGAAARFFLSRNEWATGRTFPHDWFLVYCRVDDPVARIGEVIGWCTVGDLADHIPDDRGAGEWSSTKIEVATKALRIGLPQ